MEQVISAFEKAANRFYEVFSSFNEEQVNAIPFEGSWTPAQVVVHILKSQARLPQLLSGEKKDAGRDPGEKKQVLEKIFLDFSTKMNSPEFILPTADPQDKKQLLENIKEKSHAIINAMRANDISSICVGYELPALGELTGIEWGWFSTFHVQRHTHQLEKMEQGFSIEKFTD